ncbi:MAG: hypothetical protein ABW223_00105 [Rariglobus sp.]
MKPLTGRSVLWAALMAFASLLPVSAQTPPAAAPVEVEVGGVKFNAIRQPNSQSAWYEAEIDVIAKPSAQTGRFLNRVKVTLSIATKVATPGTTKPYEFYRSSAELVSLETGRSSVRFYLPPEVLKRDGVRGDPDFWLVELSVGGTAVAPTKNAASSSINDKAKLDNFKSKVASEAGANDGILVPQYLSPYAIDYTRQSPSYIRVEGGR